MKCCLLETVDLKIVESAQRLVGWISFGWCSTSYPAPVVSLLLAGRFEQNLFEIFRFGFFGPQSLVWSIWEYSALQLPSVFELRVVAWVQPLDFPNIFLDQHCIHSRFAPSRPLFFVFFFLQSSGLWVSKNGCPLHWKTLMYGSRVSMYESVYGAYIYVYWWCRADCVWLSI